MFPFPLPDETQQPGEHLTGPYDAVVLFENEFSASLSDHVHVQGNPGTISILPTQACVPKVNKEDKIYMLWDTNPDIVEIASHHVRNTYIESTNLRRCLSYIRMRLRHD
jgi:hypothetical protein